MHIFRWIIGVLSVSFVGGSVACFALFISLDIDIWLQRARTLRRGAYMALLFWFNIEVWGRVILTIVHWNQPS